MILKTEPKNGGNQRPDQKYRNSNWRSIVLNYRKKKPEKYRSENKKYLEDNRKIECRLETEFALGERVLKENDRNPSGSMGTFLAIQGRQKIIRIKAWVDLKLNDHWAQTGLTLRKSHQGWSHKMNQSSKSYNGYASLFLSHKKKHTLHTIYNQITDRWLRSMWLAHKDPNHALENWKKKMPLKLSVNPGKKSLHTFQKK